MIKHLTKHGNSLALVIDRPILEMLEIDAETPLTLSTDGRSLVLSPVRDAEKKKALRKALDKINREYGPALKRLAE